MKQKWYVVTLLMRCDVGRDSIGPWTCDEQIKLIRATNPETAYAKSIRVCEGENQSYLNSDGETVYWTCIGLVNLEELFDERIQDGVEIRSRIFQHDDPDTLIPNKAKLSIFLSKS